MWRVSGGDLPTLTIKVGRVLVLFATQKRR